MIRERILLALPDGELRKQLRQVISDRFDSPSILEADRGLAAWNILNSAVVDILISAYRFPDISGFELLHRVRLHALNLHTVVIADEASVSDAVKAIKAGAHDFLVRPFSVEHFLEIMADLIKQVQSNRIAMDEQASEDSSLTLIGQSKQIKEILALAEQIAPSQSTVLITGESGTGKEILARLIHRQSKRANKPLVVVDCGTIPAGLVESELFGHVAGAFTGATANKTGLLEQADGGTVLLDEIGEFPLDLQVKILRVLQNGEIRRVGSEKTKVLDLRVFAATNRDLEAEVQAGNFREDLYYRLNVVRINMPPLRERLEDIEPLVNHFLKKYRKEYDHSIVSITRGAMSMLCNYHWPGNVRELEHTILQMIALYSHKTVLEERDLPIFLEKRSRERKRRFLENALEVKLTIEDYAREFVRMFEGELSEKELASALGITTKTLWEKRRRWGMPRKKTA